MNTNLVVITGQAATDLTLPAESPIKDWIEDAVGTLRKIHNDKDIGFALDKETAWSIAPIGGPPIEREESLNSADLVDGDLVQLVPVSRTERYRPLVEDNIDAVAVLNPAPVFGRADVAHWLDWLIPVTSLAIAAAGVAGWSADTTARRWWGPALLILAVILAGVAHRVWRRYDQPSTAETLFAATAIIASTGAALSIPLPHQTSWLGAPHLAAAAFTLFVVSLAVHGGPRRRHGITAAAATASVITAAAATASAYGWHQWVWPGVVAAGLFTITNSAKLTVVFARISLPPVPVAGETIDISELLDPVIDTAAETSSDPRRQSWRAVLESVPSSSARLVERAKLSQQLLAGFVFAGAMTITVGSIGGLQEGHFFIHTIVIAALVSLACAFRARFYADRTCAWALLTAAATTLLGCVAKLVYWNPSHAPAAAAAVTATTVVAALGFAATRDTHVTAITKQILERIDGLSVAAIVPLLLWVAGLYDMLRNIAH